MKYFYFLLSILILSCSSEHSTEETDTKSKIESKTKGQGNNFIINSKVTPGSTLSSILKKYNVEDSKILIISEQKEIEFNFNNLQLDKDYKIILDQN